MTSFQTLVVVSFLAAITSCIRDDGHAEGEGKYASLFDGDQYAILASKRVRKEIRDLTDDEWDAIAAAMNVMKTLPTAEGRAMYGDRYLSYDDMVCQHARATLHSEGDIAHIGPIFNVWHRAFVLSFENILRLIDSSIEAAPYWDFRRDMVEQNSTYDLSNSVMFSERYFGEYSTANDADGDYAVKTGKFAYWPIDSTSSSLTFNCTAFYRNAFGFLRHRDGIESTPYVTRFGGSKCGEPFAVADLDVYVDCLNNVTEYASFVGCYNFNIHARPHIAVGGTRKAFPNQTDSPQCTTWHTNSWVNDGGRKWAHKFDCFDCPVAGSCVPGQDDPYSCAMCDISSSVTAAGGVCDIDGVELVLDAEERPLQQIFGDFLDQATSPNDPIFMFHHVNMDRYLMEWQLRNYDQAPYYGHPTTGLITGSNLYDVMSPEAPFTNLFDDDDDNSGPYTVQNIWDATTFLNATYVYDTVLDLARRTDSEDETDGVTALYLFFISFA